MFFISKASGQKGYISRSRWPFTDISRWPFTDQINQISSKDFIKGNSDTRVFVGLFLGVEGVALGQGRDRSADGRAGARWQGNLCHPFRF